MKTILAATDFSENSKNACTYAVKLAQLFNCKIILFHAFQRPSLGLSPGAVDFEPELSHAAHEELEKLKSELLALENISVEIETLAVLGEPAPVIYNIYEKKLCDLIIAGLKGRSTIEDLIVGSTTDALFKKSECPLLAIPDSYAFKKPHNFLIAESAGFSSYEGVTSILESFTEKFHPNITLLTILKDDEKAEDKQYPNRRKMMKGLKLADHFVKGNEIYKEILQYADAHPPDLIILFPKHHSFWETVFNKRVTSNVAKHTKVPILSLPI